MMTQSKPYQIIKIDKHTNKIQLPTILLTTRSGNVIGQISKYTNFSASLVAIGIDEISFDVNKYVDGKLCPIWDDLESLKLIEVKGYGVFQITVSYTDNTETVKAIHGQSLEVELGQLMLNDFHVNDDEATDMAYTIYSEHNYVEDDNGNYTYVPTVFYNENDPEYSLLHRVLADKAPHWRIGHVPVWVSMSEEDNAELASEFERMYTVDGTSIYDFLTGEVAKETNVVFVFDTFERIIHCYNLFDCYNDGELKQIGIGEDTTILASKKNFVSDISIDSNADELKNCFRVEGGDDIITSMVAAVNTNGTNYIWKFSDMQLEDMSDALKEALVNYQSDIDSSKEEYEDIFKRLCDAYEELYLKESALMPNTENLVPGDAETQYNKIVDALKSSTVYVTTLSSYTATAHNSLDDMIIEYASVFGDSRFEIEVVNDKDINMSQFSKTEISSGVWSGKWKGKIKVTQKTNEKNTYPTIVDELPFIEVNVLDKKANGGNGELEFMRQKVQKALAENDMTNFDFEGKTDSEVRAIFQEYALNRLKSFMDAYDRCCTILADYGTLENDEDHRKKLYDEYKRIHTIVSEVHKERFDEVEIIRGSIKNIGDEQEAFQKAHDFQTKLGTELYLEFCKYRREDTYSNSNYISDNCKTTAEQLNKAKELLEVANAELSKACMLQRSVSTSLNNLLVLPEFEALYDQFALFNYIRLRTDDEILKLRLVGIDFNGDSAEEIDVTFSEQIESVDKKVSDIESVISQASSIATSYSSTVKQAKNGSEANKKYTDMVNNGLVAAQTAISSDIHNEVEITGSGITCRRMDDVGSYGDKQIKISGNRMYFTKDSWKSVSMAIGEILFNGEDRYGVIAECLVGKMIAGENMSISNENGTVEITGDGITIYDNKKNKVFFADNEGNLNLIGNINATGGKIGGLFISDKSLSIKYGFSYKSFPVDPENNMHYFDYDYYYYAWLDPSLTYEYNGVAKLRCYYDIELKGFYIKMLSNVGIGEHPNTLEFEFVQQRYTYCCQTEEGYVLYTTLLSDNIYFDIDGNKFLYGMSKKTSNTNSKFYFYNNPEITYIGRTTTNGLAYKEKYKMVDILSDFEEDIGMTPCISDEYLYFAKDEEVERTGLHYFDYDDIVKKIVSSPELNNNISSDNTIYIGEKGLSIGRALKYSLVDDALKIKRISSDFYPLEDNRYDNGAQLIRWRNIYANTSVISTSDRNKKQNISYDLDKYIALFDKLKPCSFEFIENTSGRTHIGYIAQDVEDALNELGISSTKFGGFCKSSINGVDIYSLRYDEFQGLYDAKIKQLEKRLEKLENYILKDNKESAE